MHSAQSTELDPLDYQLFFANKVNINSIISKFDMVQQFIFIIPKYWHEATDTKTAMEEWLLY